MAQIRMKPIPRDAAVAAPITVAARVGGRTSPEASVTGACSHAPHRAGCVRAPDPDHPSWVMTGTRRPQEGPQLPRRLLPELVLPPCADPGHTSCMIDVLYTQA